MASTTSSRKARSRSRPHPSDDASVSSRGISNSCGSSPPSREADGSSGIAAHYFPRGGAEADRSASMTSPANYQQQPESVVMLEGRPSRSRISREDSVKISSGGGAVARHRQRSPPASEAATESTAASTPPLPEEAVSVEKPLRPVEQFLHQDKAVAMTLATLEMAAWCFATLEDGLRDTPETWIPITTRVPIPTEVARLISSKRQAPLFVTWNKKKRKSGWCCFVVASFASIRLLSAACSDIRGGFSWELRGCLGCLKPTSIAEIPSYALKSAFEDSRFKPIARHEFPELQCSVSLLGNFERASHLYDWSADIHGIAVQFADGGNLFNATYLPGVVKDHGMSHETAIRQLISKSGWRGSAAERAALLPTIEVTRYQASKAHLSHAAYFRDFRYQF